MYNEDQLHKSVKQFLDRCLPPGAVWTTVFNEGKRGWKTQAKMKSHGVLAGWPDIQVFYDQRVVFIELKAPKGVVSKNQKSAHKMLEDAGFPVYICRNIDDVQNSLSRHIPLRISSLV